MAYCMDNLERISFGRGCFSRCSDDGKVNLFFLLTCMLIYVDIIFHASSMLRKLPLSLVRTNQTVLNRSIVFLHV